MNLKPSLLIALLLSVLVVKGQHNSGLFRIDTARNTTFLMLKPDSNITIQGDTMQAIRQMIKQMQKTSRRLDSAETILRHILINGYRPKSPRIIPLKKSL